MSMNLSGFLCDRCGAHGDSNDSLVPAGWLSCTVDNSEIDTKVFHLCDTCSPLWLAFMQDGGAGFELTPSPQPPTTTT